MRDPRCSHEGWDDSNAGPVHQRFGQLGTRHDGGQAVLMVALLAVLAAGAAMGVARLGAVLVRGQQARAVADAAALAAVDGGPVAAGRVAAANGGRVLRVVTIGDDVLVEVVVGDSSAVARATRAP